MYKKFIVESKTDASLIQNADSWILNYYNVIMLHVITILVITMGAYTGL